MWLPVGSPHGSSVGYSFCQVISSTKFKPLINGYILSGHPLATSNKMRPLMCWPWLIFFMHSVLPDIYLFDIHQHVSPTRAKIFFHEPCLPSALRAASHRRGAQRTVVEWMKFRKQCRLNSKKRIFWKCNDIIIITVVTTGSFAALLFSRIRIWRWFIASVHQHSVCHSSGKSQRGQHIWSLMLRIAWVTTLHGLADVAFLFLYLIYFPASKTSYKYKLVMIGWIKV